MTSPGRPESRFPPPYDPSVDSCRSSEEKDKNCHIRESGGRNRARNLVFERSVSCTAPRLYRIVLHMSLSHALLYNVHYRYPHITTIIMQFSTLRDPENTPSREGILRTEGRGRPGKGSAEKGESLPWQKVGNGYGL